METRRTCKYCHIEYPIEDFECANIINGKFYRRRKCRQCYRGMKKRYIKSKYLWLSDLKSKLKCSKCSESHISCLDFHHLNPDIKEINISMAANQRSIEHIKEEMDKCIVLCSNCHRKLHWNEKNNK